MIGMQVRLYSFREKKTHMKNMIEKLNDDMNDQVKIDGKKEKS